MKGLPDDRCQCPHWGYVFKGKMTARYADRDEVFEVVDAFYTPPGHTPVKKEPGTEILWFSPSEELRTAEAVMMKNMQAIAGRLNALGEETRGGAWKPPVRDKSGSREAHARDVLRACASHSSRTAEIAPCA
jgi:hypothetical protein